MEQKQHLDDDINDLNNLFNTSYLPKRDFSLNIMDNINRLEQSRGKLRFVILKRVTLVVAVVGLLTGFSFVAADWFELQDKDGNKVMEVHLTDKSIPTTHEIALNEIREMLPPGESATVYFGTKEDIENKNPENMMGTISPYKYTDYEQFLKAVSVPFKSNQFPRQLSDEYRFKEASIYMNSNPSVREKGEIVYGIASNGQEYGYYTQKLGSKQNSIILSYQNGKHVIDYNIHFTQTQEETHFYDDAPTTDNVTEINGVDTYYYKNDHMHENSLIWAIQEREFTANYVLTSHTADQEELVRIARSTISGAD